MRVSLSKILSFVVLYLVFAVAASALELKIASIAPEGSQWMLQMRKGAAEIKARTAGRVVVKFYGGEPAHFLDVGGGADKAKVANAFRILLADDRVKGVLINIFGGIMRCDILAQGVVDAARELSVKVPLVVRMQGTNVEQGRKILADSGLTIITAETMAEAAEKIVNAVKSAGERA